ncbi:hypothetical protein DOTSEDRAFT_27360 [Dothistroma septosporum NZE10]|uniref:Heterokaryon incompatibility domain-containing protein n=1 Tax=Dothistroma septosporum (strain NZE10 / CBS 128990) TaxID=675120 RepID=N1PEH9_DOTSN|nr:hypothetical protein DOTSEDRAFT_27360 [Dothistroma septosporum NZE10]
MPSLWKGPSSSLEHDRLLKSSSVPFNDVSMYTNWPSIYSFFSDRWFTRAWIIQEIALGQQAVCYQGRSSTSWNEIATVATLLYKHRHKIPGSRREEALRGIENVAQIWSLGQRTTQSLTSLLLLTYTFNCTVPQDLVFATLGLRHRTAQTSGSASRITPAYNEPLQEVYAKATKAAIIESQSLGILKHAHSLRPIDRDCQGGATFPSWALRLDCRSQYRVHPISYRGFRFNAHGGAPLTLWPNESSKVLRVMGVRFDVVTNVSPQIQWQTQSQERGEIMTAADVVRETYQWAVGALRSRDEDRLVRNFALTMAAGQDADGRNIMSAPKRLHAGMDKFLMPKKLETQKTAATLPPNDPDIVYTLSAMIKSAHHRTVFVTRSGSLGLGTENVHVNDVVCVLFGGSVPFVLRPEGHFWRFVGDAFVEEIMDGHYVRTLHGRGLLDGEKQWIKIR